MKIKDLPLKSPVDGTERLIVVDASGNAKRVAVSDVREALEEDPTYASIADAIDDPASNLNVVGGPQRLLDAVQSALSAWPEDHVHGEVFQMTVDENFKPEPFEATVASTGQRFLVPADRSLLDVLRDNDFAMPSSCEMGVCGSCECGYRDGLVLHRDKVLPTSKRQDRLMLCVSRARVSVTLDL